jgi:predicted RNA binding protein YcfA (HicA-like mRNA interferase family)
MKFSELVRLLEENGFRLVRDKEPIRFYAKPDWPKIVRVDFHGAKEIATGTLHAILKGVGINRPRG